MISNARSEITNMLTVDLEDYFQVSAFDNCVRRDQWDDYPCRVVDNTHRILETFAHREVYATFFVLGWVAERFPELIKQVHRAGHEIACHGYWHRLVYSQTPQEFREDLRRARDVLQDIAGLPVTAYRAPSFSITKRSEWALEILVEEGFTVDSSIFPVRHDRYGMPDAPTGIRRIDTAAGTLWEVPPSVTRIAGVNVPIGGGYFRLYPWAVTCACLRWINRRMGEPFMFYIHPWELDPDQPRVSGASALSRFRHYQNLHRTEQRLQKLIDSFRMSTLTDVLQQHQVMASAQPVTGATNGASLA